MPPTELQVDVYKWGKPKEKDDARIRRREASILHVGKESLREYTTLIDVRRLETFDALPFDISNLVKRLVVVV